MSTLEKGQEKLFDNSHSFFEFLFFKATILFIADIIKLSSIIRSIRIQNDCHYELSIKISASIIMIKSLIEKCDRMTEQITLNLMR